MAQKDDVPTLSIEEALVIAERHMQAMFAELRARAESRASANPVNDTWTLVQTRQNETYRWMDGNLDTYPEFNVFANSQTGERMSVARREPTEYRGRTRTWSTVFSMEGDKIGLPVAVFYEPDDFAASHEMVALIRGKGPHRRAFYGPSDALPDVYRGFKLDNFRDRLPGPGSYNRVTVVAAVDDHDTMLRFGAIQKAERFDHPNAPAPSARRIENGH